MPRRDFKRELKDLYSPPVGRVTEVVVPPMNFLMVDGEGDPNTSASYAQAIEALYAVSYAVKFAVKRSADAVDYGVMPLEGLWWAPDPNAFVTGDKASWQWTMMIMQPELVDDAVIDAGKTAAAKKRLPALELLRFECFDEGLCAQTMHVGPFSEEGPTIQRVHDYIEEGGHSREGKHHEIYLSDIRKADPARWRTIVRQPMR